MKKDIVFLIILIIPAALHAEQTGRFITKLTLPSGQTAVVAEGDYEARSTGSFSVRLYDAAPPADATTFFTSGMVHVRDGIIEKVSLADVTGNKQLEIIVIIRAAGTGGYLSAHAFTIDGNNLILSSSVKGLPPDADPVAAIRKKH